jgi:hypothetical protein
VAGAINAIAADPTNANIVFVATVNGGIWRTNDATDSSPFWTPLTDQYPSLSIGAIALSPLDSNGQPLTANTPPSNLVLYAGTGRFSSGYQDGGPRTGLLRTTDGGNTWTELGQSTFQALDIASVVPTTMAPDGTLKTQVILVGTNGGAFRSTDGGVTWGSGPVLAGNVTALVPNQSASDLVAGLGNPDRFYAAVTGTGPVVFRSDSGGATWNPVHYWDLVDANGKSVPAARIRLSVHNIPGDTTGSQAVVWEGVVTQGTQHPQVSAFYRSADGGDSWVTMSLPGDLSGGPILGNDMNLSMAADPTNPNVVFVGGDANGFTGRLFRGDFSSNIWVGITTYPPDPIQYTGTPHPDSRNMVFDANGDLLECDDGGIYRLNHPDNFGGVGSYWSAVNGNIRPTEFYSVAYDPTDNLIIGGAQDNGSPAQASSGNFAWGWVNGGDGGFAQVGTETTSGGPLPVWYTFADLTGGINGSAVFSRLFPTLAVPGPVAVGLQVEDPTGAPIGTTAGLLGETLLSDPLEPFHPTFPDPSVFPPPGGVHPLFFLPYAVNAVDPTRMLIGTDYLYESLDRGDDLVCLDGLTSLSGGLWAPTNPVGHVDPVYATGREGDPIAYGGYSGGVANPEVIWVGAGGGVRLRTSGTGLAFAVPSKFAPAGQVPAGDPFYPGSTVQAIALDPTDWHSAFVVDGDGRIYHGLTNDDGSSVTWTELTGNLYTFTRDLRAITVYHSGSNLVLLVGGQEGVYRTLDPGDASPLWSKFGRNLPNAPVTSLHYDPTNDVLLAGTFGRGAWTIPNLSASVLTPGTLEIDTSANDNIGLALDANNPLLLDLSVNNIPSPFLNLPFASLQQIIVNGVGGNNTLTLIMRNGNVIPDGSLTFTGGSGVNALNIYDQDSVGLTTWTVAGSTLSHGSGLVSSTIDYSNVSAVTINAGSGPYNDKVYLGNLATPVLNLVDNGTSPDGDTLTVEAAPGTNYITAAGSVPGSGVVTWGNPATETINYSGMAHFTVDASPGTNNTLIDPGSQDTSIIGGPGTNTVSIANTVGTGVVFQDGGGTNNITIIMGNLLGPVTLNGTTGTTQVTVVAPAGNNVLTLSATQLTGASETINFNLGTTLTSLVIDGSAGTNQLVPEGSPPGPLTLINVIVATSTDVVPSVNPSTLNQAVTFTATVSPAIAAAGTPVGSVQFQVDGANFGAPVALSGGVATLTTSALSAGPHTITALYSGTPLFLASSGSTVQYVQYNFSGFLLPLNHNLPFEAGQTVPVKFQLSDALGNFISSLSAVTALVVVYPDGSTHAIPGLRYDPIDDQYIANWSTKGLAAGSYTISLSLLDGTTHNVTVRLTATGTGTHG